MGAAIFFETRPIRMHATVSSMICLLAVPHFYGQMTIRGENLVS